MRLKQIVHSNLLALNALCTASDLSEQTTAVLRQVGTEIQQTYGRLNGVNQAIVGFGYCWILRWRPGTAFLAHGRFQKRIHHSSPGFADVAQIVAAAPDSNDTALGEFFSDLA